MTGSYELRFDECIIVVEISTVKANRGLFVITGNLLRPSADHAPRIPLDFFGLLGRNPKLNPH